GGDRLKALPAGQYRIELVGGDGLRMDTSEFKLDRDGRVIVRITLEKRLVPKKELPKPEPKREEDSEITALREAVKLDPMSAAAHYALAQGLRNKGDVFDAIPVLREVIKLDPKHAAAHSDLGWLLFHEAGDRIAGEQHLREATKLRPAVAGYHNDLGCAL